MQHDPVEPVQSSGSGAAEVLSAAERRRHREWDAEQLFLKRSPARELPGLAYSHRSPDQREAINLRQVLPQLQSGRSLRLGADRSEQSDQWHVDHSGF